jgi:hypothetical protein
MSSLSISYIWMTWTSKCPVTPFSQTQIPPSILSAVCEHAQFVLFPCGKRQGFTSIQTAEQISWQQWPKWSFISIRSIVIYIYIYIYIYITQYSKNVQAKGTKTLSETLPHTTQCGFKVCVDQKGSETKLCWLADTKLFISSFLRTKLTYKYIHKNLVCLHSCPNYDRTFSKAVIM